MRYLFLFIIVLTAFSCGEDGEKNACDYIVCDEWESCNTSNKRCELKDGRCLTLSDCINNQICNENHTCVEVIDKCKDVNCDEWEKCNPDNGECEAVLGRCSSNDDCEQTHICDLEHICVLRLCEENETKDFKCGFNNRGSVSKQCLNNEWVELNTCNDPDTCLNEDSRPSTYVCGINADDFLLEFCFDGQWVLSTECNSTDVCVNGTERSGDVPCGNNNEAVLNQICINGQWVTGEECIIPFITKWKTDNEGVTNANQIKIPINPQYEYDYKVDCNRDGIFEAEHITTSYICEYEQPGTYTVLISGEYPAIMFTDEDDHNKLIDVVRWGSRKWKSMENAFYMCKNLTISAADTPNLTNVQRMGFMFMGAENFNSNINHWDVSNATDMLYMFWRARAFNQPLNNWNVSNVVSMQEMFSGAISFNQDLSSWDVSSVVIMGLMFNGATSFNQPLNSWNVSNVRNMDGMFASCSFNQPLNNWNLTKVENMRWMFSFNDAFNQDLSSWDVSNVTDMLSMFYMTPSFNCDLSSWDVSNVTTCDDFSLSATAWTLPKPNFTQCNPE